MRQASNGTACDSFLPFGRKCCEAKCDGKRGDYDRGSNVEDLELYECIPTYGAFKKPKRTYGVYEPWRPCRTLSQLPESDYVCEETCRFLYKGEQKDPLNYKTLKVYRSGGVEVKDDTALCVSKNKMQKPKPRSLFLIASCLSERPSFLLNFAQVQIFAEAYRCIFYSGDTDYFHTLRLMEAILESAPNSLVQLYALVIWAIPGGIELEHAASLLRISVLCSFVSVGLGLAMWEQKVQFRTSSGFLGRRTGPPDATMDLGR
eukprot:g11126.t1